MGIAWNYWILKYHKPNVLSNIQGDQKVFHVWPLISYGGSTLEKKKKKPSSINTVPHSLESLDALFLI